MSSGVAVNKQCLSDFEELKLRKKYLYIIYKLSENNEEIVVEKAVENHDKAAKYNKEAVESAYNAFLEDLPANDPCYAVYDFHFNTKDGERNKIVFYSWVPEGSKVRQKMLYASSKDALRRKLTGVSVEVQGTDDSEVDFETVENKCE